MTSVSKIHLRVARPLEWLIATILVIMVINVGYQVFSRYSSALPRLLWTEEVARTGLVWLVAMGAAYAFIMRDHFVIDLLSAKFKAKYERSIDAICYFV